MTLKICKKPNIHETTCIIINGITRCGYSETISPRFRSLLLSTSVTAAWSTSIVYTYSYYFWGCMILSYAFGFGHVKVKGI